jgi:predicted phosphodiesterase
VRIAILSDIHGNYEALDAVLADIEAQGIRRIFCLGDVVGYGASPNECCARISNLAEACVLGNHDEACLGRGRIEHFNSVARMAALWTQNVMDEPTRDYLERAPMTFPLEVEEFAALLVHASPYFPSDWHYILSEHDAQAAFNACEDGLIFVGHSHVPGIFLLQGGSVHFHRALTVTQEPGLRYLVNVGSVGQPRDGDPRASWCLLDCAEKSVGIQRVNYDVEKAQMRIREAQLPEILASRLAWGE